MFKIAKSHIKREMQQLYPAPDPKRKEEFLWELPYPKASFAETAAVQIGYIHKWVWALSLLLVTGALAMGEYLAPGGSYGNLWCMSGVMPLLAVLAVTETFRSSAYGMAELEMASKHSLPQILLIRMGVIGSVDFFLAVAGILFIVRQGTMGMLRAAVYLIVPWLCACVLAFQIEKYAKGGDTVWYCTALGCFLCMGCVISGQSGGIIYDGSQFYLWMIAFCALLVCFARQIWHIRHGAEEWNLYLT